MASPGGKTDAVTTDDTGGNAADDAKKKAQQMNYELHMTMKYMYQRVKTFEVDASIPCEFEKYMIWHYVLGNSTLFNDKRGILKTENELDIDIETIAGDEWLIIDIGTLSTKLADPEITKTRDLIVHAILRGSDALLIKSFSTIGVDKRNFADLMMEKIDSTHQHKSWLFTDQESDLVHCVYEKELSNFVESVSKEIFTRIGLVEIHSEQKLVFYKVLQSFKVREKVKSKYKGKVKMAIDCKESANSCELRLQGQRSEVESAKTWIQETYIKDFVFNELRFGDIKNASNSHAIERIVEEVFQEYTEVFWYVNSNCEKISICSKTSKESDNAVAALKKCLKKGKYPIKVKQHLEAMPEFRDGRACMEGVSDNAAEICVIGIKSFLQKINDELKNDEKESTEKHYQPKIVKVCLKVDDEADLEVIRTSPEFKSTNDVEIKEISEVGQLGFMLVGPYSMCADVKEKLTQRIDENKERMKGAAKQHWDLQSHHVIVHSSCETTVREDIDVLVDTGEHGKAGFDGNKKLYLPEWIGDFKQKKEDTRKFVKEMLQTCQDSSHSRIKMTVKDVHRKLVQQVIFQIFETLLDQDFQSKDPVHIFLCTDTNELFQVSRAYCQDAYQRELHISLTRPERVIDSIHKKSSQSLGQGLPKSCLVSVMNNQLGCTMADVIVNTTGRDLDLKVGSVSSAILKFAGEQLQEDIRKQRPNGISFGEVIQTDGYAIQGCKYILHGAIDEYQKSNSVKSTLKELRKFVQECLMKADQLECEVIAFPAVGTGRLGYPKSAVAKAMFGVVRDFQSRLCFVRQVQFVIYHKDTETLNAFNKEKDIYEEQSKINNQETTQTIGPIEVTINQGQITDIATEGLIYIWEKSSVYAAKPKYHELLKHINNKELKSWMFHRDSPQTRWRPLETQCEDLAASTIIHVLPDDSIEGVRDAILAGLRKADDMVSVTVFLSKTSQFINHGEQLINAFIDSILELNTNKTSLLNVQMMIDSKRNNSVDQLKVHLEKGLKRQKTKGCLEDYTTPLKCFLAEPQPQSMSRTKGKNRKEDLQVAADAFIKAYQEYLQKSIKELCITLVCRDGRVFDVVTEKLMEYKLMEDDNETPQTRPPLPSRLPCPEGVPETVESESLEECVICMDHIGADRKILVCGHAFHEECIDMQFRYKKKCPICGKVCGELKGDQPEGEREDTTESWNHCAGFADYGRISITYRFPNGKQGSNHPNPGKYYNGITRTAYLPDTTEGREVLEMLKIAFDRKLTFTIGASRTTGEEGVIAWNDIHHKTDPKPYTQFGYPDPEYLDRVREELAVKGVTVEDIPKKY